MFDGWTALEHVSVVVFTIIRAPDRATVKPFTLLISRSSKDPKSG